MFEIQIEYKKETSYFLTSVWYLIIIQQLNMNTTFLSARLTHTEERHHLTDPNETGKGR